MLESVQVRNRCNLVLGEDEYSKMVYSWEMVDLPQQVRAQVKEMKVWQRDEVLDAGDLVVLQVEILDLFFAFEERDVLQTPRIKGQLLWVALSLYWPPIDDQNVANLRQLDVDREGFGLDVVQIAMSEQVPISLVLFLLQ